MCAGLPPEERPLITDLRNWPAERRIDGDICIIGGGAAGITLALQFAETRKLGIVLLEAGGEQPEAESQQLYAVDNEGELPISGMSSRLRLFGGTTNHWDGRCAPLDESDFQPREWVPYSGWPITRRDLDEHYRHALQICELGQPASQADILKALNTPQMRLDPQKLSPQLWRMSSPTRFGARYGSLLKVQPHINVLLHANVVDIGLRDDGGLVNQVTVVTPERRRHVVTARYFVLACGGIENPRLLLASNSVQKAGIGNQRDLVGRFFMQHLRFSESMVMEGDPYLVSRIYSRHEKESGCYVLGLRLSDAFQKTSQVLNGAAFTYPDGDGDPDSGRNSASRLLHGLSKGHIDHLGHELFNIADDFSDVVLNVRQRFLRPGTEPYARSLRQLVLETEQAPNPQSRIRLGEVQDVLGMRRVVAEWRATDQDFFTCQKLMLTVAEEMTRLYKARVSIPSWLSEPSGWQAHFRDVAHHLGTTRMASSEQRGVVDSSCAVFGVPNLFVAGSSVFPTAGHANPTMTIVALAVRLGLHLKAILT